MQVLYENDFVIQSVSPRNLGLARLFLAEIRLDLGRGTNHISRREFL